MRCILAAPKAEKEDWRQTSIFQMLVRCGNQVKKLIIDGGSCMNVVSSSMVECLKLPVEPLKLPVEPHPQPYKVAWIDNTSIPVTHRCLISFSCGIYSDSIMCDIIPMKVIHILLGRPWLFDRNVEHYGGENTYALMVDKKEVVLKPMTLAEMDKFKVSKPKVIEGKDLEAKNYGVAIEATKIKPDQAIEVPQIPADFFKDYADFSLKDLSKPLCPMHEYSTGFVKGTSCLESDAELKIDASDQGKLEVMQQDSKEMETIDEVVEIERAAYQNYKEEVKTITQKSSQFSLYYLILLLN